MDHNFYERAIHYNHSTLMNVESQVVRESVQKLSAITSFYSSSSSFLLLHSSHSEDHSSLSESVVRRIEEEKERRMNWIIDDNGGVMMEQEEVIGTRGFFVTISKFLLDYSKAKTVKKLVQSSSKWSFCYWS